MHTKVKKINKFVVGVIAAFKKEKGYLELIKIAEEKNIHL